MANLVSLYRPSRLAVYDLSTKRVSFQKPQAARSIKAGSLHVYQTWTVWFVMELSILK